MKSARLKLWAICDAKGERFDLGLANPSPDDKREAVIGRVLIFSMYWGAWRGTRVRTVAGGSPESMGGCDVTASLIEDYIQKNPTDEITKRALSEPSNRKPSTQPEIVLTYNNGIYEMLGDPL